MSSLAREDQNAAIGEITTRLRAWFGDSAGAAVCAVSGMRELFPGEEEFVLRAVARRREEFAAGRWCAREALAQIGVAPVPVLVGRWRQPLWPPGIIGSITHAAGLCAAVAMPAPTPAQAPAVGIDLLEISQATRILPDAARFVAADDETAGGRDFTGEALDPLVLLFSAKESVVKAVSARLERFVDLTEIRVQLEPGAFRASCCPETLTARGWWAVAGNLILTAALLEA